MNSQKTNLNLYKGNFSNNLDLTKFNKDNINFLKRFINYKLWFLKVGFFKYLFFNKYINTLIWYSNEKRLYRFIKKFNNKNSILNDKKVSSYKLFKFNSLYHNKIKVIKLKLLNILINKFFNNKFFINFVDYNLYFTYSNCLKRRTVSNDNNYNKNIDSLNKEKGTPYNDELEGTPPVKKESHFTLNRGFKHIWEKKVNRMVRKSSKYLRVNNNKSVKKGLFLNSLKLKNKNLNLEKRDSISNNSNFYTFEKYKFAEIFKKYYMVNPVKFKNLKFRIVLYYKSFNFLQIKALFKRKKFNYNPFFIEGKKIKKFIFRKRNTLNNKLLYDKKFILKVKDTKEIPLLRGYLKTFYIPKKFYKIKKEDREYYLLAILFGSLTLNIDLIVRTLGQALKKYRNRNLMLQYIEYIFQNNQIILLNIKSLVLKINGKFLKRFSNQKIRTSSKTFILGNNFSLTSINSKIKYSTVSISTNVGMYGLHLWVKY